MDGPERFDVLVGGGCLLVSVGYILGPTALLLFAMFWTAVRLYHDPSMPWLVIQFVETGLLIFLASYVVFCTRTALREVLEGLDARDLEACTRTLTAASAPP